MALPNHWVRRRSGLLSWVIVKRRSGRLSCLITRGRLPLSKGSRRLFERDPCLVTQNTALGTNQDRSDTPLDNLKTHPLSDPRISINLLRLRRACFHKRPFWNHHCVWQYRHSRSPPVLVTPKCPPARPSWLNYKKLILYTQSARVRLLKHKNCIILRRHWIVRSSVRLIKRNGHLSGCWSLKMTECNINK